MVTDEIRISEATADRIIADDRGASTGTTADDQLVLQQQRFGNNRADTAGAREPGQGDEQMYHEKKQVAHRRARLPGIPVSTRLLACWVSRYDRRIRTPQAHNKRAGPKPAFFDCSRQIPVLHVHAAHAAAWCAMRMLIFLRRLSDHDLCREQ